MIEDSLQPQISFFKGLTFSFRDEGLAIVLHAFSFTGKELVTVNGTVVSEARGFSKHTQQVFDVDALLNRIVLQSADFIKGHLECALLKNGHITRKDSVCYHREPSLRSWSRHIFPITGGILVGWLFPFDLGFPWGVGGIIFSGFLIGGLFFLFTQKGKWQSELSFPQPSS